MLSLKLLPDALARYHHVLTARRVANAGKVVTSYLLSRILSRDVRMGNPFVLMVEPTNLCNLRCPLCPSGNGSMARPRGTMAFEAFAEVFEQLAEDLLLLMLWNQGEPFLNRQLCEMVRLAKSRDVPTITSTNGHFVPNPEAARDIVRSGLDEIVVSLDGATPETYARYRVGGDFEKVVDATRHIVAAKREAKSPRPLVHLQFIIMRHNEGEISAARALAGKLGVDRLSLKTTQVYSPEEAREYLPVDGRLSRYRYDTADLVTRSSITNACRHLWYSTVINWDGEVSPCCFDKDARFGLGNALSGEPFGRIWAGAKYRKFRNAVLRNRASFPICTNCSEGLKGQFFDIEVVS